MKKLPIILASLALLAVIFFGIDRMGADSGARRADTVRIGGSKKQIEEVLGHPIKNLQPLPNSYPRIIPAKPNHDSDNWAYGILHNPSKVFHLKFPYISLGNANLFRWFKADKVEIEYDSLGRVTSINEAP